MKDTNEMNTEILKTLRLRYPWPIERPNFQTDGHGWFGWCHKEVLDHFLTDRVKVIIELGSWLGKSTRWFCNQCQQATIVAVDHWLGTPEIALDDFEASKKMANLYETFMANCWRYQDKIIPIRKNTVQAIKEIEDLGLIPDLIYVDASHNYEDVKLDLETCHKSFPGSQLCGDDYGGKWQGVKLAVDEMVSIMGNSKVYSVEHAWAIVPEDFVVPENTRTHDDKEEDYLETKCQSDTVQEDLVPENTRTHDDKEEDYLEP